MVCGGVNTSQHYPNKQVRPIPREMLKRREGKYIVAPPRQTQEDGLLSAKLLQLRLVLHSLLVPSLQAS